MGLVTAEFVHRDELQPSDQDDLPFCHEMTSLDELRALSDPLRVRLYRLLREDEHTVKELCDLLGESSTRLYYHVGALERVGLVQLVRTEARSGIVQKYYRAVARFVSLPAWLLHEEMDSPQSRAAADWYGALIEHAAADVRALFGERLARIDRETIFFTRNFVRLSPERAREFCQRLEDLQAELLAADDEQGETRFAFTTAFVPVQWNEPDAGRRSGRGHDRHRKRNVDEDDTHHSPATGRQGGGAGKGVSTEHRVMRGYASGWTAGGSACSQRAGIVGGETNMHLGDEGGFAPATLLRAGLSRRGFLRWTALAGGLAAVAPLLAACGGDDDDEPTATSAPAAPTATSGAGEPTATAGGGTSEPTATTAPAEPSPTVETVEGSGGSIITVHSNDADSLDPQRTVLGDSWVIFRSIYDTLIAKNPALEFEPLIAESWEVSDDGLEYTYAIRSGLKFHDGNDVTAEDVKFTFDRASNPDAPSQALSFIDAYDHAELVDASTVKLFLKNPSAPFTSNIAVEYFGILPQAAVEAAGDDFGTNPVGSGPWVFKEWIQGEQCSFTPFADYVQHRTFVENKGAPRADELVFRVITEAQTQIAALQTGETNHIQLLPTHEYRNFKDDPDYIVLLVEGSTSIVSVEFVTEGPPPETPGDPVFKAPFDDLRMRQAVAYALNPDEIIEAVLEGLAKRNYGPMPTGLFAWDPAIEEFGYHYDPEQAAALLDEVGWTMGSDGVREKDGQKLDLTYWMWTGATEERASQVIQNQLGESGIKINLESLDIGTMVARLPEAQNHLNWMEVGWPEADILYILTSFGWGVGRYQPADYIELLTLARETVDLDERREYYFEAQKLFLEDLPWVPLWSPMAVTVTRAELKNFKLGADGTFIWEDAFVES